MTSIWDAGLTTILNIAGKPCTTVVNGVVLNFQGILDQAEIADETELGINVRMQSVLRMNRSIARKMKGVVNQAVEIDGIEYIMSEPIAEDDGATFVAPIYPKTDSERVGW